VGAAAHNRGSRVIARDLGGYRDPVEPQLRPAGWGDKALARAIERACRILAGNRRLGRSLDVETLTACVMERAHVGAETARRAAELALVTQETSPE